MDDLEKFAAERSHVDAQFAHQQALAAAQSIIIVNGGAATATLALASSNSEVINPSQTWLFAIGLAFYIVGVAVGAFNLRMLTGATYFFMLAWQERTHGNVSLWKKNLNLGINRQKNGNLVFTIGYLMFVIGSVLLGFAVLSIPQVATNSG